MTTDSSIQFAKDLSLLMKSEELLIILVHYLLKNYEDAQWDGETRELLEVASRHLWNKPIEWNGSTRELPEVTWEDLP